MANQRGTQQMQHPFRTFLTQQNTEPLFTLSIAGVKEAYFILQRLICTAKRSDFFFHNFLNFLIDFRHKLYNCIFVWIIGKNFFEGFSEHVAHIAVNINFTDTNFCRVFKVVKWRATPAMEANLALDCVANLLQQLKIELFWHRIQPVQVTDLHR